MPYSSHEHCGVLLQNIKSFEENPDDLVLLLVTPAILRTTKLQSNSNFSL